MAKKENTGNVYIDPSLRADIMRHKMETKDTLESKGSLYVGTGEKTTIGSVEIPDTKELKINDNVVTKDQVASPNENYGKVLMVGADGQLGYGYILSRNLDEDRLLIDGDLTVEGRAYFNEDLNVPNGNINVNTGKVVAPTFEGTATEATHAVNSDRAKKIIAENYAGFFDHRVLQEMSHAINIIRGNFIPCQACKTAEEKKAWNPGLFHLDDEHSTVSGGSSPSYFRCSSFRRTRSGTEHIYFRLDPNKYTWIDSKISKDLADDIFEYHPGTGDCEYSGDSITFLAYQTYELSEAMLTIRIITDVGSIYVQKRAEGIGVDKDYLEIIVGSSNSGIGWDFLTWSTEGVRNPGTVYLSSKTCQITDQKTGFHTITNPNSDLSDLEMLRYSTNVYIECKHTRNNNTPRVWTYKIPSSLLYRSSYNQENFIIRVLNNVDIMANAATFLLFRLDPNNGIQASRVDYGEYSLDLSNYTFKFYID